MTLDLPLIWAVDCAQRAVQPTTIKTNPRSTTMMIPPF